MLNSVAVLSDVHGVLPALDAVLAEPEVRHADLVVLTGDHAAGPQPVQVLDRMLALGERAVMVRGNADRELAALARGVDLELDDPVSTWAATQLTTAHVELLGPPHPLEIVLILPLEAHLDEVLSVDRKVVADGDAAARTERKILALPIVLHHEQRNL